MGKQGGSDVTKRHIQEAFLKLYAASTEVVNSQRIGSISVTDICKKAGISRSTFYNYYGDSFDIMQDVQDTLIADLDGIDDRSDEIRIPNSDYSFSPFSTIDTLRYLADNRETFVTLLGEDGDPLFKHKVVAHVQSHFKSVPETQALEDGEGDIFIDFLVGGILSADYYWLRERPDLSPEEMSSIVLTLVSSCVRSLSGLAHGNPSARDA